MRKPHGHVDGDEVAEICLGIPSLLDLERDRFLFGKVESEVIVIVFVTMTNQRVRIMEERIMREPLYRPNPDQLANSISNCCRSVRQPIMISSQARNFHWTRKFLVDPIPRLRVVALVTSGCQIAKQLQCLLHREFCCYGFQNLQNLLFQFRRDIVERYIWPKVIAEPKDSAVEVKEIARDHELETLCVTPPRFIGHVRNEAAIGFGIEVPAKDDLLAVAGDYV